MFHLLQLTIPDMSVKHLTVHDDKLGVRKAAMLKELKLGIFPNAIFQQAYNESPSKQVDEIIVSDESRTMAWLSGFILISEVLKTPGRDVRIFSNVGDWLGRPGWFTEPDRFIVVTDIYKYIIMNDLFTAPLNACYEDARSILDDSPVVTHLLARDAFYDQTYTDKLGVRTFARYEPRTDKSRESTLGVDHHAATPVIIDWLEYPTIDAAALAYNLPSAVVFNRINSGKDEWIEWKYKNREDAKCITYILRHKDDPGFYVGFTTTPKMRFHTHISKLKNAKHGTPKLQALIDAKGADGLYHEIVLEGTEPECRAKEQELVTLHKDDPNLLNASLNTQSAISHHVKDPEVEKRRVEHLREAVSSDEYREKMGESMKAAWSVPGRKEARSGAGNPFAKCVSIQGVVYGSVIDAVRAKAGGLTDWVIRTRLKAGSDPAIFYCDAEGNKIV